MNFLKQWLARRQLERDLAEEIQQHLDEKVESLVEAGLSYDEARQRANREFGNRTVVEERGREIWRWNLLEDAWADMRHAVRQWRRTPAFTIATLVTLALGIGANTAVFSLVNGLVLRPLPFPDADRLVSVESVNRRTQRPGGLSYPNFFDVRRTSRTLAAIASYRDTDVTLTGRGLPVHLRGQIVSWNLFQTLQVAPALGRVFLPDDEQPGARVVVLSHAIWTRHFGADRDVVGRAITLGGNPYVVAGIAPPHFSFPVDTRPVDLWITLAVDATSATRTPVTEQRGARLIRTIARLAPDATLEQARDEMNAIAGALASRFPENASVPAADVRSEIDRMLGPARGALLLLWATVLAVLLVAVANVSNLLVARTADRRRELDVRLALGGSRSRIVRQLVAENLLLGIGGSLAGVAVAYGGLHLLAPLSDLVPRMSEAGIDIDVLGFAALVAVVVTMAVTLAPALRLSREHRSQGLLAVARTVVDGRHRLSRAVVVCQVAASLVLLSVATLLVSGLVELLNRDLGFDPDRLMAFDVSLPGGRYDNDRGVAYYDELTRALEAVPGVERVATAMPLPLAGHQIGIAFDIEGRPTPPGARLTSDMAIVSPRYFAAIGTPLVAGRDFTEQDDGRHPRVVIVNQAFAQKFFPGESAIGKRIQSGATGPSDDGSPMREIVGVVGNARQSPIAFAPEPVYYLPFRQMPWGASVVVRAAVPAVTLVPSISAAVTAIDDDVAVHGVRTFDDVLEEGISAPRTLVWLMGSFALIAVTLTATGLYGLLAYGVHRRTREFGLRMALGARRSEIVRGVTAEALGLVAIGLAIGGAGVAAADVLVRSQLPDVGPALPALLAVAGGVMLLTALASSAFPARRAASVNPTEALRSE